jgi:hypothetical protein
MILFIYLPIYLFYSLVLSIVNRYLHTSHFMYLCVSSLIGKSRFHFPVLSPSVFTRFFLKLFDLS